MNGTTSRKGRKKKKPYRRARWCEIEVRDKNDDDNKTNHI